MKVLVDSDCLSRGKPKDQKSCALALAVTKATGRPAEVWRNVCVMRAERYDHRFALRVGSPAYEFVQKFDRGEIREPQIVDLGDSVMHDREGLGWTRGE